MDAVGRILDRVYAAATGECSWPEALDTLLAILGYDGAAFYVLDSPAERLAAEPRLAHGLWHRLDPAAQAEYETHYFRLDPRFLYCLDNPGVRVLHDRLHTPEAEMDRHPYYAWYLRNQPTRFYLGWRARPGLPVFAGLTLHRRGRLGPASEAEVALLAAVEPHLQRALLAEWRLHRAGHPAILAATDDQQVGMVLLAADGRVLHANAAAGAIAARADALALGRTLEALRPGDRERLAALLADTLAPVVPPRAPAVLRLMRRWGGPDYVVSAMPLGRGADLFPPWRPAACVTILDPAATAPNSAAMLREAFGLTPAEARLVARLADGDTLAGAAEALGVAMPTVRTHLAAAFRKTGTRRQAELVRLATLLPNAPATE